MNWKTINKPCKKLLASSSGGASSGRNSAGRITIWHRGGGSKRLHRNIDLKRTTSSVGVVERIEYDPNRSSKIALVRWTEGVEPIKPKEHFNPPKSLSLAPSQISAKSSANFPLSCLASNSGRSNGLKDVFISAFTSGAQISSLNIPRIAVVGARPGIFAPRMRGEVESGESGEEKAFALSDVRRWKKDSVLWEHRMKRKSAVSWNGIGGLETTLDFVKDEDEEMEAVKPVVDQVTKTKDRRAPVSYILASHELEVGQMVMNCDSSKASRKQRVY